MLPHSLCFLRLQPQTHSSRTCRPHRFRVSCKTVQIKIQQPHRIEKANPFRPRLILSLKPINAVLHMAKISVGLAGVMRLMLQVVPLKRKKFEQEFDGNGKWEREIDEISVGVSKSFEVNLIAMSMILEFLFGLPWVREGELGSGEEDKIRKKWSNTLSAESLLPEHELRRLRNISLRMLERTKVGAAGFTQALVDAIQEKWTVDEVVKLKFEEPLSLNMRRTHAILESKTGGLVIWRSGSFSSVIQGNII
ncbi:hypothetical protein M0R45_003570 [Rubus argutus]|uniref:CRM domain-containing protein n=1 Tax=Rubus argutus TaxID=59490 RepID=A0AAW1YFT1_RUBAR